MWVILNLERNGIWNKHLEYFIMVQPKQRRTKKTARMASMLSVDLESAARAMQTARRGGVRKAKRRVRRSPKFDECDPVPQPGPGVLKIFGHSGIMKLMDKGDKITLGKLTRWCRRRVHPRWDDKHTQEMVWLQPAHWRQCRQGPNSNLRRAQLMRAARNDAIPTNILTARWLSMLPKSWDS